MNWNILDQPLGTGIPGGYSNKKEIPVVPIAMAAGSVLSSLWGGSQSAKAAREAQAKLDAEKAKTEAERIRAKYQNWLDTASGQNTVRMLREESQRSLRNLTGAAAVGGATDAAVAAQKELNNQKEADVIAQGVAAHEDKKDAVDASYRQQLSGLTQQQIAADKQQADNMGAVGGAVSNALATGAIAALGDTKLMGEGSPGGGGATPNPQQEVSRLAKMGLDDFQQSPMYKKILESNGNFDIFRRLAAFSPSQS